MTLSIIIVSYNTKEYLKSCLDSIGKAELTDAELIIVDNASIDGTAEEIKSSKFPPAIAFAKRWRAGKIQNLKLIENKVNVGYAKANNIGVSYATGKYILFLNPDTIVNKNAILSMVEFMDSHTDAGVSTCRVELPNGKLDDASHRGFPTPWNAFCHFLGLSRIFPRSKMFAGYSLGWMDLSKTHEIDACAGAFMLVRREAGEEVQWWDEDFFWYGEDLDFCYRLKQKGWKIYFVPSSSILHYKGISGGIKSHSKDLSTASIETRKKATYARFEAMKLFYRKHYSKKYPRVLTWLVMKTIDLKLWFSLKNL